MSHKYDTRGTLQDVTCGVKIIAHLQCVQNNAARLICDQPHGTHSAPIMLKNKTIIFTFKEVTLTC